MKKHLIKILLIIIALIVVLGLIHLGIIHSKDDFFSNFGNFFGGVIGPLVALTALVFAYQSYSKQLNQTYESNSIDNINKMLNELTADIDRIEYKEFRGVKALYKFDQDHWGEPNSVMNHLILIFSSFETLILTIKNNKYIDKTLKDSYIAKTYLMYNGKITWPVFQKIYNELLEDTKTKDGKDCKGLKHHNDIFIILNKYERLIKESYKFLLEKGLLTKPTDFKILKLVNEI